MIHVTCPECEEDLALDDDTPAGETVDCYECGAELTTDRGDDDRLRVIAETDL